MKKCPIILAAVALSSGAFAQNPELLSRPQGWAQEDLLIRASGYGGTGISLNGLNLKAPYSAHFNADLPVPIHLLSEPEVWTGLKNSSGYPVGTAVYRILPLEDYLQSTARIGTQERYGAGASFFSAGVGGFIDAEKALRVDYDANDFNRYSGGLVLQKITDEWQFDLLATHRQKIFGAQGYYGIPQNIDAEERADDSLLFMSATHGDLDGSFMRVASAFRRFDDEYRIPASAFSSSVRSYLSSVMAEGRTLEIQHIALYLRGDLEHEGADGTIGNHHRTRGSILLLPEARFERFTLKAGFNSVFQTGESTEWLPQAGVDFFATDNLKLYAAYSETVQQPDFQTLYDADPYRTGNAAIPLQKSQNSELGLHQFLSAALDWRAAVFNRRQHHAADWVKLTAASPTWTAVDLGALDVVGVDAALNYRASDDLRFGLCYQWAVKDSFSVHSGLYELDYPEHLLGFSGEWQMTPELRLFLKQTLQLQSDNPVRTSDDFGFGASLGLQYAPDFADNLLLSLQVDNPWDSDFQAVPGLRPRPTTVVLGVTMSW